MLKAYLHWPDTLKFAQIYPLNNNPSWVVVAIAATVAATHPQEAATATLSLTSNKYTD